jgi:hypothetical protein
MTLGASADAQPAMPAPVPALAIRIEAPASLIVGTVATIAVFVSLERAPAQPLLLTLASEGAPLRVLRGRMLRGDATRTPSGELRFEVPVSLLEEGTAVLRADLLTYRCAPRCSPVRASASQILRVSR